jgi:hypothetical protein
MTRVTPEKGRVDPGGRGHDGCHAVEWQRQDPHLPARYIEVLTTGRGRRGRLPQAGIAISVLQPKRRSTRGGVVPTGMPPSGVSTEPHVDGQNLTVLGFIGS